MYRLSREVALALEEERRLSDEALILRAWTHESLTVFWERRELSEQERAAIVCFIGDGLDGGGVC